MENDIFYGADLYHVLQAPEYWLKIGKTETDNFFCIMMRKQWYSVLNIVKVVYYDAYWFGSLLMLTVNRP